MSTVNYSLALMSSRPGVEGAQKLYYAKTQASGVVTIDDIVEEIAYATAMTDGDVLNAIRGLIKQLTKHLTDGKIVRMDKLGSFQLQVQSKGAEEVSKFTSSNITGVTVQYRPGTAIKAAIRTGTGGLTFRRVNTKTGVTVTDEVEDTETDESTSGGSDLENNPLG